MLLKFVGPLLDIRTHLLILCGVAVTSFAGDGPAPGASARETFWEPGTPPIAIEAGHDPAACLWCQVMGPEEHRRCRILGG